MFALTIKNLLAHKARLLTTAFAVLLGVAFMAGTFVFTDTIGATYDSALARANSGIDAYVRAPSAIDVGYGEAGPRIDAGMADDIAAIDGVDQVALRINGYAQVLGSDGEPAGDLSKNPAFGTNWVTVDELNPYVLVSGHAPTADDEVVIDVASARRGDLEAGDVTTVLTKREPREVTIAGIARFGTDDSPAGASAVLFTDTAAAELLADPGQADAVMVTADPGVTQEQLTAAVDVVTGADVEVVTGAVLTVEDQQTLADEIGGMAVIFKVFAFVAVLVGAFIINNTFSITVAQRTREMAVLRALGASGRQVRRTVLVEALVAGSLASAAGLGAGLGVAAGLRRLMSVFGFDMPDGPTVVNTSAMVLSFTVGVVVTVLSAWLPARRAARIAPIAALRDSAVDQSAGSVRRAVVGTVLTAGGVAAVVAGVTGDVRLLAVGALATVAGVAVIGPVIARPLAAVLGGPLRLRGVSGEPAARNAGRNPKRTARTAASLMIGVALVGFMTVFAASAKTSLEGSLETEYTGTHIVDSGAWDASAGLSPQLADTLRVTDGVDAVTESRVTEAVVDGEPVELLSAFETSTVDALFDLGRVDGDVHGLGSDGIAVSTDEAERNGWSLGSVVPVTFPGGDATFTVEAIYDGSTDWVGRFFLDLDGLTANGGGALDHRVYVAGDEAAITAVAVGYPSATVLDKAGFLDLVSDEIDTVLGMFYALLMLAVVIALLGIANTLALSIVERTRELGLLRAVGTTRSQVRTAVRWESILIALFGTTLGLAVGTFFGWAIVESMQDEGIDTLTVPVGSLGIVVAIAAVAGAAAAVVPARRAARLDVLSALGAE